MGFQRSSPQNNFRRIVAATIPAGEFCFDTISYVPEHKSRLSLTELLSLLNSRLLDWYFRLGSSNSKVNEYQFNNLPVPSFSERQPQDGAVAARILALVDEGSHEEAFQQVRRHCSTPPFGGVVRLTLAGLAERIIAAETRRGPISRRQRAQLSDGADALQRLIDRILFTLAGIDDDEAERLGRRLEAML